MNTGLTGRWGEQKAAEYLKKRGYKTVGMNFRCRVGEIDVIAENRKYIVFCEVKLRKSDSFAQAREYVTAAKQDRLRSTASIWLSQNETDKQPRFDIIEIYAPNGADEENYSINHIENAFE
jgi:putative endonuclease